MSRPILNADQTIEAARLREERGWSYARIGVSLGVSAGAIQYQCLKQGAISPRPRRPRPRGPMVMAGRNGGLQRRFTEAEDAQLLKLSRRNLPLMHIAKAMGRARTSCRMRLLALALREEGYGITEPAE